MSNEHLLVNLARLIIDKADRLFLVMAYMIIQSSQDLKTQYAYCQLGNKTTTPEI
jgi:hypothetical protein